MRALLLGYSSIARRRVLPAMARAGLCVVDVASKGSAAQVRLPTGMSGDVYADYQQALERSPAELVYVSTPNNVHATLATGALERGRHVIVDKPLATSLADVKSLVQLARNSDRLLAEATVNGYHAQFSAARAAFRESDDAPRHLTASFTMPDLASGNYRHDP